MHVFRNPAQPQTPGNWMDLNSLTKAHSASNNREGRLNTECEINNRSAANLRSLNIPSVIGQTSHYHAQNSVSVYNNNYYYVL